MRNLSFKGRAIVANMLGASKLWYLASFDHVPKEIVNEANNILWDFIWKGKREIIKRAIIIQRYEEGGKKVVDIEEKIKALQLKWLIKLLMHVKDRDQPKWMILFKYFIRNYDKKLQSGYEYVHLNFTTTNTKIPKFYSDILNTWKSLKLLRCRAPTSKQSILNEYLWHNTFIKENGDSLYYERWSKSGIMRLNDIWDERKNDWLEPWEIVTKIRGGTNRHIQEEIKIEYETLLNSIPALWKDNMINDTPTNEDYHALTLDNYNLTVKDCKSNTIYWKLIGEKWKSDNNQIGQKWENKLNLKDDYKKTIFRLFNSTGIVSNMVNDLNWRIYHWGLVTGSLAKIFKVSDGKCRICGEEETLEHAIFECKYVKVLWKKCKAYLVRVHKLSHNTIMKNLAISGLDCNGIIAEIPFCITSYVKYTIWNIRNSVVFNDIKITTNSYVIQLKYCLLSWINTVYFTYKKRGQVMNFLDKYSNLVRVDSDKCTLISFIQQD